MDKPAKLRRKSSEEALIKKMETKKKPIGTRNPLRDLNVCSLPPTVSSEAPRRGCLSFLLSNSSSKNSIPRSKSLPKTPQSAPPNRTALPSKNPINPSTSRISRTTRKNPSKHSLENPKQLRSQKPSKPKSPDLLRAVEAGDSLTGKNPELKFKLGLKKNCVLVSGLDCGSGLASTPQKTLIGFTPEVAFGVGLDSKSGTLANGVSFGHCLASTPEKEGEQQHSNTPTTTPTPPVQASISPEILCGSSVAPTPVCFGAGHLIAGVHDRRKCRPRGILTIGGGGSGVLEDLGLGFADGHCHESRISCVPPPLSEASIQWLPSPNEDANAGSGDDGSCSISKVDLLQCPGEASVNWLLFPCQDAEEEGVLKNGLLVPKTSFLGIKHSSDRGFLRCSPANSTTTGSPELGGVMCPNSSVLETTPSSGYGIRRNSTTTSDISPFSMILQRAAASSGREVSVNYTTSRSPELGRLVGPNSSVLETTPSSGYGIERTSTTSSDISPFSMILQRATASSRHEVRKPQEGRERYRYGSVVENSPFSGDLGGNFNGISTPLSYSNSNKHVRSSPLELDSVAESLGAMSLSQQPVLTNDPRDCLPLPGLSFQFASPTTPSNSIDLARFQKPLFEQTFAAEEFHIRKQGLSNSDVRISWREGLVSRIFEMDEFGFCQWLSDEEEDVNCRGTEEFESEFNLYFDQNSWSSMLSDGNEQLVSNCFGAIEFSCDELCDKNSEGKVPPPEPISCAESISTEGGGLVSSGDSDWTLFYKNHLFEMERLEDDQCRRRSNDHRA